MFRTTQLFLQPVSGWRLEFVFLFILLTVQVSRAQNVLGNYEPKSYTSPSNLVGYTTPMHGTGLANVTVRVHYQLNKNFVGDFYIKFFTDFVTTSGAGNRFVYNGKVYDPSNEGRLRELIYAVEPVSVTVKIKMIKPNGQVVQYSKTLYRTNAEDLISNDRALSKYNPEDFLVTIVIVENVGYKNTQPVIEEIKRLENERAIREKAEGLIKEADALASSNRFQEAKEKLLAARKLLVDYARIDQKLLDLERKEKEINKSRASSLISESEQAVASKEYGRAKQLLQEARQHAPNDGSILEKIQQIEKLQAEEKESNQREEKAKSLLDEARKAIEDGDLERAKDLLESARETAGNNDEFESELSEMDDRIKNESVNKSSSDNNSTSSSGSKSSSKSSEASYSRYNLAWQFESEGDYYRRIGQYEKAFEKYNQSLQLYDNPRVRQKIEENRKVALSNATIAAAETFIEDVFTPYTIYGFSYSGLTYKEETMDPSKFQKLSFQLSGIKKFTNIKGEIGYINTANYVTRHFSRKSYSEDWKFRYQDTTRFSGAFLGFGVGPSFRFFDERIILYSTAQFNAMFYKQGEYGEWWPLILPSIDVGLLLRMGIIGVGVTYDYLFPIMGLETGDSLYDTYVDEQYRKEEIAIPYSKTWKALSLRLLINFKVDS